MSMLHYAGSIVHMIMWSDKMIQRLQSLSCYDDCDYNFLMCTVLGLCSNMHASDVGFLPTPHDNVHP